MLDVREISCGRRDPDRDLDRGSRGPCGVGASLSSACSPCLRRRADSTSGSARTASRCLRAHKALQSSARHERAGAPTGREPRPTALCANPSFLEPRCSCCPGDAASVPSAVAAGRRSRSGFPDSAGAAEAVAARSGFPDSAVAAEAVAARSGFPVSAGAAEAVAARPAGSISTRRVLPPQLFSGFVGTCDLHRRLVGAKKKQATGHPRRASIVQSLCSRNYTG